MNWVTSFVLLSLAVFTAFGSVNAADCRPGGTDNADGTCNCPVYRTGENCENINCLNSGYLLNETVDDRCHCPVGYYGLYCESYQQAFHGKLATKNLDSDLFFVDSNKFILFFNTRIDNAYNSSDDFRSAVLANIGVGSYSKFYLYEFDNDKDNTDVESYSSEYYDLNSFKQKLNDPSLTSAYGSPYCVKQSIIPTLTRWIKYNKFSQQTINIFTQLPSDSTTEEFEELSNLAIAFKLQFNIYFAFSDAICDQDDATDIAKLYNLELLSERTGGIFWSFAKYYPSTDMLQKLIHSTSNLQLLGYKAYSSNCPTTLSYSYSQVLFNPFIYAIVKSESKPSALNFNGSLSTTTSATGTTTIASFTTFVDDTISVTGATGACSLKVVADISAASPQQHQGVKIYPTFTDTLDADSTYFAMKAGIPLYIRLHLENMVNTSFNLNALSVRLASDCQDNQTELSLTKSNSSTFEFHTTTKTSCLALPGQCLAKEHWLTVTYNVTKENGDFTVSNVIPIKCLGDTELPSTLAPPTTQALTTQQIVTTADISTVEQATNTPTVEATTTEAPTTEAPSTAAPTVASTADIVTSAPQETTEGPTAAPTVFTCPEETRPTMVIGYSHQYDADTVNAFLRGPKILNSSMTAPYWGSYVLFSIDAGAPAYNGLPASTFNDFIDLINSQSAVYSPANLNADTDVVPQLKGLLNDPKVTDRSSVLILVGKNKLTTDEDQTAIFQLATTKQIRVNFYIDKTLYDTIASTDPDQFKFYEKVAAISGGHFIITDVNKPDVTCNDNNTNCTKNGYVVSQKVFAMLFYYSLPHKLAMSKILSVRSNTESLGVLDLTSQSGNVTFFLTASYSPYTNNAGSVFIMLFFQDVSTGYQLPPFMLTCGYGNIGCDQNFMNKPPKVILAAGTKYQVSVLSTINNPNSTLTYRLWQNWQDSEEYNVKTEYISPDANLQYQATIDGPRYDVGATPKVTLSQLESAKIANVEIEFYNCNGEYQYTFDQYNYATQIESDICSSSYMVNPFICQFNQECSLMRNNVVEGLYTTKYKITTTDNTTLEYSTNFWCRENIGSLQCPGPTSAPDMTTAETGSEEEDCMCLTLTAPHRRGPTCTVTDCSKNGFLTYNSSTSEFDCHCKAGYTGPNCEIGICSNTASRTAKDVSYRTLTIAIVYSTGNEFQNIVRELSKISIEDTSLDNIWQFNVFSTCNGNPITQYFGTSKNDFKDILQILTGIYDSDKYCGNNQNVDLNYIVSYGLQPVGKEVRGVFWVASHNSNIVQVNSLMDYYKTVQGHKQEVFLTAILNPVQEVDLQNFNDTLEAVRVTGGERIDLYAYDGMANYMQAIIMSKTSLNYYELTSEAPEPISTETSSLVTISNIGYNNGIKVDINCEELLGIEKTAKIYNCSEVDTVTLLRDANEYGAALISVRVLNGYTPAWVLVNETNQDNLEAMPVLNSYPSIAFDFEDIGTLSVEDKTPESYARQATRENCVFTYTSTFQLPVTEVGYDNFLIKIDNKYSKVIPYVVTDTLEGRCKNGNVTGADAKCECDDQWSGPDCSRPVCQSGSINTMQNVCYCDLTHGGPTCGEGNLLG